MFVALEGKFLLVRLLGLNPYAAAGGHRERSPGEERPSGAASSGARPVAGIQKWRMITCPAFPSIRADGVPEPRSLAV